MKVKDFKPVRPGEHPWMLFRKQDLPALAYDLCYDGWPRDFCDRVAEGLLDRVKYRQRRLHPGHANYHPCSNYYGPSHGSSGLASLAIWQEKGPEPPQPEAPFNVRVPSITVVPASDYKPPRGVPVSKFYNGLLPAEWLFACGFKPKPGQDPLGGLGGAAAPAVKTSGTGLKATATIGRQTVRFDGKNIVLSAMN